LGRQHTSMPWRLKGSGLSLDSMAMTVENQQFLIHHALAYFSQAAVPDIIVISTTNLKLLHWLFTW